MSIIYGNMNRTIAKNCRNLNKNLKESLFEFFFYYEVVMP